MSTRPISKELVLSVFRRESCLDLRRLAGQLGVDAANRTLALIMRELLRAGLIRRVGLRGSRPSFVLATFES